MYMQSDLVEVKVTDCAGTIILNRPEEGNRLTRIMLQQIGDAIDDLYLEKKVRAIILTGAGDVFCAGLELQESQTDDHDADTAERWGEDAAQWRDLIVRMLETTKPIIASVHGPALSAGAALALASDVVIASENSSFGLPDPRHGLVAGVAAPLLFHRLGGGQAARLLLTSATIDAEESYRLGLFHELTDAKKVWARAVELARECAAGAPEAIQLTKRLLNEVVGEQLQTQLAAGAVMRATAFTTESAREGIAAYIEQRPPKWR
jgi:enoyl-CoA hydratase/carnithine racemase